MTRLGADAVSPVIGTILMIAIVVSVITIVFAVAVPQFRRLEAQGKADTARSMMARLHGRISDLVFGQTARSDQVSLHLPDGEMFADGIGSRWVLTTSTVGTPDSLNFTVDRVTDGDARYNITNRGMHSLSGGDALQANHSVWRSGRRVDLADAAFSLPAVGDTEEITVLDADGDPVPLREARFRIRIYNDSSKSVVGEAWIVDTGSVRWSASLYDGFHEITILDGTVVVDEPARDARLQGFTSVRTPSGRVSISLVRLVVPEEASPSIGAGPVVVPLRSQPARSILDDATRANVTLTYHLDHADLLHNATRDDTGMAEDVASGRLVVADPVQVDIVDHVVALPEGLVRG